LYARDAMAVKLRWHQYCGLFRVATILSLFNYWLMKPVLDCPATYATPAKSVLNVKLAWVSQLLRWKSPPTLVDFDAELLSNVS